MNKIRCFLVSLALMLFGLPAMSWAEDIDLYSANSSAGVPNVLLILDNAANFSSSAAGASCIIDGVPTYLSGTVGGIEQCALYNVIKSLPDSTVNIGLMIYNANNIVDINGGNCGGTTGGCLAVPLSLMDTINKAKLLTWIKTWTTSNSNPGYWMKANSEATAATMQEAWAYFKGTTGLSGRNYSGVSPTAGCQKNYVVFVGNSYSSSGTPGDSKGPQAALENAPNVTTLQKALILDTINTSCGSYAFPDSAHETKGFYADEWARYMAHTDLFGNLDGDQVINTYTVGVLGASCQAEYAALLTTMGKYGEGKYFPTTNYDELVQALLNILNEVQAVNSVFASSSLPVSVNTQGTYLNQIYMGMFRPDANANPRWLGNLKQYKFTVDSATGDLKLGDAQNPSKEALSAAGTGFISPNAVSFWTSKDVASEPDSTGGFWVNDPNGAGGAFDSPDGEWVEKGAAAQQLRRQLLKVNYSRAAGSTDNPRSLYTYCPSGSGCVPQLTDTTNAFAVANSAITGTLLNATGGTVSVSSITRSGTTATVTTSSAHNIKSGQSVTISGATQSEYNGTFTPTIVSSTKFTYTVVENPPTPAAGTYTASVPSNPKAVTLLTRVGNTATVTLNSHGYVTGQTVTISGATQTEYNGTFVITAVDSNHFSFTVVENPVSPTGGGTAKVGTSSKAIEAYNANPNPGVVRATGSTLVTFTTTTNHNFGNSGTVTISGVKDSAGNLISAYNGTFAYTKAGNKGFTINIAAVTPATPATGSIKADEGTAAKTITQLTRSGTTATATSAGHGFVNGDTVSIGGTAGTNEGAYIGNYVISNVTANTFSYTVSVTPVSPATGSITATPTSASSRDDLINWIRGQDNFGDELGPGGSVTVRPSIHADVLHSRPLVINYGGSTPRVVVYYGSNDGLFHAVNGNQTESIGTVTAGGELWGLVLPEFYSKLNRQRVNSPELQLPTTPSGIVPTPQTKDYFVDGATGVYQIYKTDGTIDKAYIYLSMRRGGRFIYALDVSSPTDPKVMWKISNDTTGFAELGQTWSRPRVALLKGYVDTNGKAKPVLIFGAGYDPAQDAEPPGTDTMGRGIYIVDAVTGSLITKFTNANVTGMNYSIPSDVALIDRDNDGRSDRLYVGDMGGNIWRVDFETASGNTSDKWQIEKLAALGCDGGACAAGAVPRKFFYPPTVITTGTTGAAGSYDAVAVGSGDREHPLYSTSSNSAYKANNQFFMVKDSKTQKDGSGMTAVVTSNLVDISNSALCSPVGGVASASASYDGSKNGFRFKYCTGEKAVNAPITVAGSIFFGTNQALPPPTNSCTNNLGVARSYQVDPFNGKISSVILDGGGMPPSATAGIVTVESTENGQTKKSQVNFCIGCITKDSPRKTPLGPGDAGGAGARKIKRTYWYKD